MKKIIVLVLAGFCSAVFGDVDVEAYQQCMDRGVELVESGEYASAKKEFKNALILRPDDAKAKRGLERCDESLRHRKYSGEKQSGEFADSDSEFGSDAGKMNVRVTLGSYPGVNRLKVSGVGSADIQDEGGAQMDIHSINRVWLDGKLSFLGGVGGVGLFISGVSGATDDNSIKFEDSSFGFNIQGGLACRLGNFLIVEAQPYAGAATGTQTVELITGERYEGDSLSFHYGLKGGAFIPIGDQMEFGVEAAYTYTRNEADIENGPETILYGDGIRYAIAFAYKF